MSFTHYHDIIDLLLAWIRQLIDFSLLFLIISLLSFSFHVVSPCFFHFLFIIISNAPLHHQYISSSSLVFLFIIVIALIDISSQSFAFSSTLNLSTSSSLKHFVVKCLQSEQNIHQKPPFSCAIVKFA